jgi:hypothetical protein
LAFFAGGEYALAGKYKWGPIVARRASLARFGEIENDGDDLPE